MRIGVLAYNQACNFGANLQLLSTVEYLKLHGHIPFVINWIPESLEIGYTRSVSEIQREMHIAFRKKYYNETLLCRNSKDVADEIERNCIEAVIIGSDAVAQHHPFLSRIVFPSKTIISIIPPKEDKMFPNVYWGTFNQYLGKKRPIAVLSASCQNSAYKQFSSKTKKEMYQAIQGYSYLSVRDDWTQDMYYAISDGKIKPPVTPDPVFAFNYNVDFVPSKKTILEKYNLPDKYILFGLFNNHKINESWTSIFQDLAIKQGYSSVLLSFPQGVHIRHSFKKVINVPLDPLDWYAIIKYSSGYIGHNMHPLVVSIHNSVPFFSFDNYGVNFLRYFVNEKSSKIYHLLSLSGFLENRVCDVNLLRSCPKPEHVLNKILNFDTQKSSIFAKKYYEEYEKMMSDILHSLKSSCL